MKLGTGEIVWFPLEISGVLRSCTKTAAEVFLHGSGMWMAIFISVLLLVSPLVAKASEISAGQEADASYAALTLHDAVGIALKKSPLLASRKNELSASSEGVKEARGELLPRLDAYSSYERLSDPQVVVPIKAFGAKPPTFSRDQYRTGVRVKMPVFEGGRLWTNLGLARLREEVSRKEVSFTTQELIYNVTNVFNEILFLKSLEKAQKETLGALKKLRKDAKTRLSVGRIAPVDLMRIDAQVAQQEHDLVATIQGRKRALELLAQLMGVEPWMLGEVKGVLREPDLKGLESESEAISRLILERPDIEKAKKEMLLAKKAIRFEKGLHLPFVDLVGDYGRHAGSGFDGDEEVWSAGVRVGLNIFSGGVISARVRQAEERYLAARNRYEHLRLTAIRQALNAISEIREASQRLSAARLSLKSARESFRVEKLKYETGAGNVTDSLLSQAAWFQAEADVHRALYDLLHAEMDYKFSTGRVKYEER